MANPTTNFGWVMPTSTSLVTNLPADFNTFGQGVDTSMAQLKGGTTGQILSKTSATDMAFTWITNDVGDITAVTAGTGISGGGTSGAVTITNSMATEITAKGDLIVGTGSATFDNLAAGTNGQTLVADNTASTGLKWATPSGGGKVLQVVSTTNTTQATIATTTLTDVMSVTITPTLSTSKIYVMFSASGYGEGTNGNFLMGGKLLRGSTTVADWGSYNLAGVVAAGGHSGFIMQVNSNYLDSPATTSATTYKLQVRLETTTGGNSSIWQWQSSPSTITVMEIGA